MTSPYFGLLDPRDPSKGIEVDDYSPRYTNGYASVINRPSILVETHVLKPYRQRVEATLSVMRHTIAHCIRNREGLKAINTAADLAETSGNPFSVMSVRRTEESRPFTFMAYPYTPYKSEVSGGMIPKWDRTVVNTIPSKVYDRYEAVLTATPPVAYAIPPEWTEVIQRIQLHGLRTSRLTKALPGTFATSRFDAVSFGATPFEGRFQPRFTTVAINESRTLPVGTVIVSTKQVGAKLLMQMLEPDAPDSLMRWGFFNNVFEMKEYYEEYAMEPVAVSMLAKDAALKTEFEAKIKSDPKFAANPSARLRWLFERSPYYDDHLNKYPVVRLSESDLARAK